MSKVTQNEKIKGHIERYGSITPLDALREYGCMRLASRMSDLKRQGYSFGTAIEKHDNANGETVRYARYYKVPQEGAINV